MTVPGPRPPLDPDDAHRLVSAARARAAILVEGWSDQAALEALARRRGRDLLAEGIVVVPIGGATNVQRFAQALGPHGLGLRLAGLCDVAELGHVRRSLERAGLATGAGTDALGFYACDADLEDELIRALGTRRVEELIEAEGERGPFLTFAKQPAHRGAARDQQLRRFMGTRSGRKIRYGHVLAAALDLTRVPGPLAGLLSAV